MYTVFNYSLNLSYKAPIFSKATVFYILVTALTFIPPLLVAYRSQGFWQKVDYYEEQPDVHFLHDLIVMFETQDPQKSFGWSTMQNFNDLLGDRVRVPMIKSTEDDWNRDGKLDKIDLSLEVPVANDENIYGVQLFVLFDVRLYRFSNVQMQGLVHACLTSGLPVSGVMVTGDLGIVQKQPLAHKGLDTRYSEAVFNRSSVFAEDFDFKKILIDYTKRNVSVRLDNQYVLWERGSTPLGQPFKATLRLNYPVQTLSYYTGFWQMMKWAWIQYFSILIVFIYFFRQVKTFVFAKHVLPSVVQNPLASGITNGKGAKSF